MSVAPTRHQVTCSSKPGGWGIFSLLWPFSVSCYLSLGFISNISSDLVHSLGIDNIAYEMGLETDESHN